MTLPWDSALTKLEKLREVLEASPLEWELEWRSSGLGGGSLRIHTRAVMTSDFEPLGELEWCARGVGWVDYRNERRSCDPIAEIRKLNEEWGER